MNKEDIDFLISIQNLEQPDFDNACLERENNRLNKENQRLNNIISKTSKDIQHELSHLKANDEVSWNDEFYTNNKLDYRKLCIALLEQFAKQLKEKE